MLLLLAAAAAWADPLVVDFLDVGQGDAILVRTPVMTVLVDAGELGDQLVAQLRAAGVTHLDLVVATHPHADHIGGLDEVLAAFRVDRYVDNGLVHGTAAYRRVMDGIRGQGIAHEPARAGAIIELSDDAWFTVLFPTGDPLVGTRSDLNSNSVVLRLDHGEVSFLLTGDAEADTEAALLALGLDPVDVLKVAHHGSSHSTGDLFLATVAPEYAVISSGAGNSYGHPDPETLARLGGLGAHVFRTDLSGDVRAVSDGLVVELFEGTLAELGPPPWIQPLDGPPPNLSGLQPGVELPPVEPPRKRCWLLRLFKPNPRPRPVAARPPDAVSWAA